MNYSHNPVTYFYFFSTWTLQAYFELCLLWISLRSQKPWSSENTPSLLAQLNVNTVSLVHFYAITGCKFILWGSFYHMASSCSIFHSIQEPQHWPHRRRMERMDIKGTKISGHIIHHLNSFQPLTTQKPQLFPISIRSTFSPRGRGRQGRWNGLIGLTIESLRFHDVDDNTNFKIYSSVFQLRS